VIRIRPATDADHPAWQAFLAAHACGDFLHDWAWADVSALDGQPQRRFVAFDGDELVAIAAAQVRRLPMGRSYWYVPHGPVLDYAHAQAAERLRAVAIGLREAARRDRAIAVKLEPRLERGGNGTRAFGKLRHEAATLQVGQTRLVELADDETMLAAFDKDTRYAIRRAEREGVTLASTDDAGDLDAIDALHDLVMETQRRAGFPKPSLQRYRTAWRGLASARQARIFEARREGELLASGMLVMEGDRSFYLFSGSRREGPGEPKRYASYALQWAMMRHARDSGATVHDLWGIAPEGAGPDHAWYGVGLFKKGFGGRPVVWAGSWDVVVDRTLYRMRALAGRGRGALRAALKRLRRGSQ
jgi:lipid II:glycine glycyltransferase (peptidoglycan interpeptide bridge formation enzyme)